MERQRGYIGSFMHDGQIYQHYIYSHDDDRVECLDEDDNVVITYTADGDAFDRDRNSIGRWHIDFKNHQWTFDPEDGMRRTFSTNLLKAEMELSQIYLKGEL